MKEPGFVTGRQRTMFANSTKASPSPAPTHTYHLGLFSLALKSCVTKIFVAVKRVDQFTEECGRGQ